MTQKFRGFQRPPTEYTNEWATWVTATLNSLPAATVIPPHLLNYQAAGAAALVGNSADQAIYSYLVLGGTLVSGSAGLRVRAQFNHSAGAAAVTYKLKFGSGSLTIAATAVAGSINLTAYIFNNGTNAQNVIVDPMTNGTAIIGATAVAPGGFAVNSAANQLLSVTFNVANTDQVLPQFFLVELIQ